MLSVGSFIFDTSRIQVEEGPQSTGPGEYTDCISGYDTKQSDSEAPVMLELWAMSSTPSLTLLPGSLFLGVVTPDRVLSMCQIELFDIQTVYLC